jgi:D-arabinan exo alpha-(1,3)/(1,5)-arabinofuranosidase (non-reducing end)
MSTSRWRIATAMAVLLLPLPVLTAGAQGAAPPRIPLVGPLDALAFAQVKDATAHRVSSNNPDPESNDDSRRPIPGETITLADLRGPGVVTHIWLTIAANEYAWPRLLRLRIYYDDSPVPSVDAPVGDFFGVGHGMERPINSLVLRNASSGRSRNAYWPMPFRRRARITITNEGRRRVANLYYHVDWLSVPSLPAGTAYFHARYRQALPAQAGAPYEILRTTGRGHYVGTVLNAIQVAPGWFGEGDDHFYTDGDTVPAITGTGTEDYVNDAWSLRVAEGPYAGVSVADGTDTGARVSAYRWHLVDPIPFATSLRFTIEHAGWTFNPDGSVRSAFEERPDLFSSVAFWYQLGVARGQPEPPYGAARLPEGNGTQVEVENLVDSVRATGGTVSVQKEVFWSKDILFLEAQAPGARLDVPVSVAADGRYELVAQMAQAPDYGIYRMLIDGQVPNASGELEHEPGANVGTQGGYDSYFSEVFVGEDRLIGWATLTHGTHVISFIGTGKNALSSGYNLGLDAIVLARVAGSPGVVTHDSATAADPADRLRRLGERGASMPDDLVALRTGLAGGADATREAAAWSFSQLRTRAHPMEPALVAALEDRDPVVRGLVEVALRDLGGVADATITALTGRLADPDENVRMMAATALAAQGPRARPALAALMVAARRPNENAHVLRPIADAIGGMGAQAREAVPVLEDLWKNPRVRWNAQAALKKVRGPS